jgi:predicted pyridoxine 5'-phosphate oxidase superfamily flavin-nucleotide-binding protein
MVLGGFWAFAPTRQKAALGTVDTDGNITVRPGPSAGKGGKGGGKGRGGPRGGSFMDRLEQRWDKRREDGPS